MWFNKKTDLSSSYSGEKIQENRGNEIIIDNNISQIKLELYLIRKYPFVAKVWKANKYNGITVDFKNDTWISFSSYLNKKIDLGSEKLPDDVKKWFGLSRNLSYEDEKAYLFSHENAHQIIAYCSKNLQDTESYKSVVQVLSFLRQNNVKIGLSSLASGEFYTSKGVAQCLTEDFAELINWYCLGGTILKNRLDYMVNSSKEDLANRGVVKLHRSVADMLQKNIGFVVANFLRNNGYNIKIKN